MITSVPSSLDQTSRVIGWSHSDSPCVVTCVQWSMFIKIHRNHTCCIWTSWLCRVLINLSDPFRELCKGWHPSFHMCERGANHPSTPWWCNKCSTWLVSGDRILNAFDNCEYIEHYAGQRAQASDLNGCPLSSWWSIHMIISWSCHDVLPQIAFSIILLDITVLKCCWEQICLPDLSCDLKYALLLSKSKQWGMCFNLGSTDSCLVFGIMSMQ